MTAYKILLWPTLVAMFVATAMGDKELSAHELLALSSSGVIDCRGPGSKTPSCRNIDIGGLNFNGYGANMYKGFSGPNYNGLETSGFNYNGLGSKGLNYNGLGPSGPNYKGLGPSGPNYSGLGPSGLNYLGLGPNGIKSIQPGIQGTGLVGGPGLANIKKYGKRPGAGIRPLNGMGVNNHRFKPILNSSPNTAGKGIGGIGGQNLHYNNPGINGKYPIPGYGLPNVYGAPEISGRSIDYYEEGNDDGPDEFI